MNNPILIPEWPQSWPCHKWTFRSLAELLKEQQISCRVWKKSNGQTFETSCDHVELTLNDFCDWLEESARPDNPLYPYERKEHNCYIDYKYMKDVFQSVPDVLDHVAKCTLYTKPVKWRDFGLPDFDGYDSTVWIGSEGSNTPCHQDSYGFNLVTQILGRKMWVLFPPEDGPVLYSTRIPYEESSVFSQVNIKNPDTSIHPDFQLSHPVVVVLRAGQSLYVPNRWWHYVESLEPSISINVWIPVDQDKHEHVNEAITRCLATCLMKNMDSIGNSSSQHHLLNPTEELYPTQVNYACLKSALEKISPALLAPAEVNKKRKREENEERDKKGEVKCNADVASIETNHFRRFQHWLNRCEIIQSRCPLVNSLKRRSSTHISNGPNKLPTRDFVKPLKKQQLCSSHSSKHIPEAMSVENDLTNTQQDDVDKSGRMNDESVKDETALQNSTVKKNAGNRILDPGGSPTDETLQADDDISHARCSTSKMAVTYGLHSKPNSKLNIKVYLLNCLPFVEYCSVIRSIFSQHESEGLVTATDLEESENIVNADSESVTRQVTEAACSEPSFNPTNADAHGKAQPSFNPTDPDAIKIHSPVSDKTEDEESRPQPLNSGDEALSTDSQLVEHFIASVLHPSVIERISVLLKENYFKAVQRKT